MMATTSARWLSLISATIVVFSLSIPGAYGFVPYTPKKATISLTELRVSSSWSPSSSKWSPSPMGSSVSAEPRVSSVRAYSGQSSNTWNARNPAAGRNRSNCYYKMLGVSISADSAELKQAFRRLVKQYHPDANPHADTTAQFQMINRAYEVLSDPVQRQKYNARMEYTDNTPHFLVNDLEGYSSQRRGESNQFGNLSNARNGGWKVRDDGRMFLTDNDNDGTPFRL
ncbi:heat shock protein [Nitzschia inconspicua]|uniref:Heat shock protein n=1 Tax=Nitzschia inconspicua TaxID=303405 RepID=A0A9K3LAW7_9STRA|nr:heat shock protein [Nitzschia inconspicua]